MRQSSNRLSILVILLLLMVAGCSGGGTSPITPGERNPMDNSGGFAGMAGLTSGNNSGASEYWEGTVDVGGNIWTADFSTDGDTHRAVGKGFQLPGSVPDFINSNPGIFKVDYNNLWLMTDETHGNIRYVIYRQAFNGIPILESRVDLRFKGNLLVMLGADVFEQIRDVPSASISQGYANDVAVSYHAGDIRDSMLYIQPMADGSFIPVWRIIAGDWLMLISAIDGHLVDETELIWDGEFSGTVQGDINGIDPLGPTSIQPLVNNRVRFVNAQNHDEYTDQTGAYHYSAAVTDLSTLVRILGRWINVNNQSSADAEILQNTASGVPALFTFDDTNTSPTEANVYYWANSTHDYIKNIDSAFTGLDFQLPANTNRAAWCNANAGWDSINFYLPADGCLNLGEIADVIIHEYTHVATFRQYNSQTIPPTDLHEGFSDYIANTITDQAIVGINYHGAGSYIRNSDNTKMWPGNTCGGEGHCLGEILAGGLWDLREELGASTTDNLFWFARYGKPTTFPDFVTELTLVDDDNANLNDGTPNYLAIYNSFKVKHGIPVPAAPGYISLTLTVTPDSPPIQISKATGGSFGFNLHVHNNLPWSSQVEAWVAVQKPDTSWYGPIIPPGTYINVPVNLTFGANADFNYHAVQSIPSGLPLGWTFGYHVNVGDYINLTSDVIRATDTFNFTIVP